MCRIRRKRTSCINQEPKSLSSNKISALKGEAERCDNINVQPRISACTESGFLAADFHCTYRNQCQFLFKSRQNSLKGGGDGYNTASPEFSSACFIHQPACTAANLNSAERDPQVTPSHSSGSLTSTYRSCKGCAD